MCEAATLWGDQSSLFVLSFFGWCAAKRDKQEAERTAAHSSHELQQQRQESQARLEELQQIAALQLQEAKDSSQDKMEDYCNNFRWGLPELVFMHAHAPSLVRTRSCSSNLCLGVYKTQYEFQVLPRYFCRCVWTGP